jgi:hypothetical protein
MSRLLAFNRGQLNSSNTAIVISSTNGPSQTNWVLDGVGNWRTVNNEIRKYNSFNELISRSNLTTVTLQSDANGNLADDGTFTYQYDYKNRLRKVWRKADNTLIASYDYDTRGRRVNAAGTNGSVRFFHAGWREIQEGKTPTHSGYSTTKTRLVRSMD